MDVRHVRRVRAARRRRAGLGRRDGLVVQPPGHLLDVVDGVEAGRVALHRDRPRDLLEVDPAGRQHLDLRLGHVQDALVHRRPVDASRDLVGYRGVGRRQLRRGRGLCDEAGDVEQHLHKEKMHKDAQGCVREYA